MAFTLEDGTGIDDANAYVDETFVDTYHADRGNIAWTGAAAAKQIAIIQASDYIDERFGRRFLGTRTNKTQGLEWPRINANDLDGFALTEVDAVPRQLQKACAEYALRALVITTLLPDPVLPFSTRDTIGTGLAQNSDTASGEVSRKKSKVGPIEKDVTYKSLSESMSEGYASVSSGSSIVPGIFIPAYPKADLWIEELLKSASSSSVERA